jgi:hypothetical protein
MKFVVTNVFNQFLKPKKPQKKCGSSVGASLPKAKFNNLMD